LKEPDRFFLQRFGKSVTKALKINWIQVFDLMGKRPIISDPAAITIAITATVLVWSMGDTCV
jgi:hypothetical protein